MNDFTDNFFTKLADLLEPFLPYVTIKNSMFVLLVAFVAYIIPTKFTRTIGKILFILLLLGLSLFLIVGLGYLDSVFN